MLNDLREIIVEVIQSIVPLVFVVGVILFILPGTGRKNSQQPGREKFQRLYSQFGHSLHPLPGSRSLCCAWDDQDCLWDPILLHNSTRLPVGYRFNVFFQAFFYCNNL